jgi:hypothetical protein
LRRKAESWGLREFSAQTQNEIWLVDIDYDNALELAWLT